MSDTTTTTPVRSVSELSALIDAHTRAIEESVRGTPNEGLYLAAGGPPVVSLAPALQSQQGELLEAIDELRCRVLGPAGYLSHFMLPINNAVGLFHAMYAYGIPAAVPAEVGSSIGYADLADRVGLPLDDTRRLVQAAAAFRIFEEDVPDESVRHNAVSLAFVQIPGINEWMGMMLEDTLPGAIKFAECLRRYPGSGEPGHTGMMMASRERIALAAAATASSSSSSSSKGSDSSFDPSKGFFDLIADDAPRVARFRAAMSVANSVPAMSPRFFVEALPWDDSCPRTVVDVGGSSGNLCEMLLRRYPGVERAVVLDLPEVVAGLEAPQDLAGKGGRLSFAPYDFLKEAVAENADAYVFRHIFHDWSDEYAARILRNLVPALLLPPPTEAEGEGQGQGARRREKRVWLCEAVLSSLGPRSHVRDQMSRSADLLMKMGFNGKERTRRDWEALLRRADPRLRIVGVVRPEGSNDSLIEVVLDAEA